MNTNDATTPVKTTFAPGVAVPTSAPAPAVAAPAKAPGKPVAKRKPVAKAPAKVAVKAPAPAPVANAPAAPIAKTTAAKPTAKPAPKAPAKTAAPKLAKAAKAPKVPKEKKPKMVRDSMTMPKAEYAVLDELKLRAAKLASPVKKTELLRAGIKALAAMTDSAFSAALKAVPSLKTGRPSKS